MQDPHAAPAPGETGAIAAKPSNGLRDATDRVLAQIDEVRRIIDKGRSAPVMDTATLPLTPDVAYEPAPTPVVETVAAGAAVVIESVRGVPERTARALRQPSSRWTLAAAAIFIAATLLVLTRALAARRQRTGD